MEEGDNFRLTVDSVEGHGRQAGEVEYFCGHPVHVHTVGRTRLTICVNDGYVERAIEAIVSGARTPPDGAVGDGKIFVPPLEETVRIRTGERGGAAI